MFAEVIVMSETTMLSPTALSCTMLPDNVVRGVEMLSRLFEYDDIVYNDARITRIRKYFSSRLERILVPIPVSAGNQVC